MSLRTLGGYGNETTWGANFDTLHCDDSICKSRFFLTIVGLILLNTSRRTKIREAWKNEATCTYPVSKLEDRGMA